MATPKASALVDDALRIKLQHERLRALLDEMDSEYGPVPARLLACARRAWPDPPRPAGRSPRRRS